MTDRLKIGVLGGGLIAQVEHIPNLLALAAKFELVAVSDPSATVRAGLAGRFGVGTVAFAEELLGLPLDALLIAAPDPWHAEMAAAALRAGLHVFCEKPICYGLDEIDALQAAQERSGRVVQVGYMKRFDPSYEAALAMIAGRGGRLRSIAVEVTDPDAWPFVGHHPLVAGSDVATALIEETARRKRAQVEAALGFAPAETLFRGFTSAYCSALVHDVNAVHGALDALGVETGPVSGAAIFAGGAGGQAAVRLQPGDALWTMSHVETPGLAHYAERIAFAFEDELVELVFPAPYLNHHPTRLTRRTSRGEVLETAAVRPGFAEPFVRQLDWFWSAIVEGARPRNTLAEARRDQALLIAMATRAAGMPESLTQPGSPPEGPGGGRAP